MLINSPYTQCDPLPIPTAAGTMLVYHANESVNYTSTVYGATETVDHSLCRIDDGRRSQHRQACSVGNLRRLPNLYV